MASSCLLKFYTGLHETDITGRLIFEITKFNSIETITRKLGANTAGEGVRFRSLSSWNQLFAEAGLDSKWVERSPDWGQKWPIWQKIPLFAKERYQAVVGLVKASKEFQPLNSESSMSD